MFLNKNSFQPFDPELKNKLNFYLIIIKLKLNNYTKSGDDVTPKQALDFVNSKMTKSNQVNKKPHINTMSKKSVNVYQVKNKINNYLWINLNIFKVFIIEKFLNFI